MNPAVYRRPDKPLSIEVRRRRDFAPVARAAEAPAIVAVDKATECHVSPPDVARRMVDYLGPQGDYLTLEPSAGTGNISAALMAAGHSPRELVQVERHIAMAGQLHKFGAVINRCFLEYAAEVQGRVQFPRIIMNPPFSDVRRHIRAARGLLGRNGHDCRPVLVALVPITFDASEGEELESLPDDTFSTARVRTKIVRFYGD